MKKRKYLDEDGLPTQPGVYLIDDPLSPGNKKNIDVYHHPIKGLCCFSEDYGATDVSSVDSDCDCHVSVQFTGLKFIKYLRSLN
jgi:hypothetical protein